MSELQADRTAELKDAEAQISLAPIGSRERYDALMEVIQNRVTVRAFDREFKVPDEHYELILDAARHAPSGANAQPWHYIAVRDSAAKQQIASYFVDEQRARAKMKMKFPTPDYRGLANAPGMIIVVSDFRWVRAFPMLKDDTSDLNRMYVENAERILLQSVAASTMAGHLAAAALGYNVWWVSAIGQDNAQEALKPLLGIPDELAVLDIFCFGPPANKSYKRWKKPVDEILNWDVFDPTHHMTTEEIEDWVKNKRHRVMYRDASQID
jgi:5,6-dimethylbenzimidazole synthase